MSSLRLSLPKQGEFMKWVVLLGWRYLVNMVPGIGDETEKTRCTGVVDVYWLVVTVTWHNWSDQIPASSFFCSLRIKRYIDQGGQKVSTNSKLVGGVKPRKKSYYCHIYIALGMTLHWISTSTCPGERVVLSTNEETNRWANFQVVAAMISL